MIKVFGIGYSQNTSREVIILNNGDVIPAYSRKELYENIEKLIKGDYIPAIPDEYYKYGEVAIANDGGFIITDGKISVCGNGFEELENVIDFLMENNLKGAKNER